MQTTIFKQKSSYWRVFALCFFTAVLLFAPHCIVDAVAGGGYFHYAGDFNDQQINFGYLLYEIAVESPATDVLSHARRWQREYPDNPIVRHMTGAMPVSYTHLTLPTIA
mgnify:CR=1 FL=1